MSRSTLARCIAVSTPHLTAAIRAAIAVCVLIVPAAASAQNPFSIEGTIAPASNSGATAAPPNAAPCVIGAGGSTEACMITDPNGNAKESGPINSNDTKINKIHTAAAPMLGDTNPNQNTDLNTVFSQTKKAVNNHIWYYFGWIRDAAGTGFIGIEFQHSQLDASCKTGAGVVDYTLSTCNPWRGRQGGTGANADFILLWDQSGNTTDLVKRNFVCSNGAALCSNALGTGNLVTIASCPNVITSTDPDDPCHLITAADAIVAFGQPPLNNRDANDASRGEVAIDLTTAIFSGDACESFANIIPSTVTGNSDSADYKDSVFSALPPISNCGSVTITKLTDPARLAGTFTYALAAGADIFNAGDVDTDCSATGSGVALCKGTLATTAVEAPAVYTETDTITNLRENDTTWTLTEDSPGPSFALKSIDCVDAQNVSYHLFGEGTPTVSAFRVEAGATTACVIVNSVVKATVSQSTSQVGIASIKDAVSITGITAGATDASSARATFALYAGSPCVDPDPGNNVVGNRVYLSDPIALTYANNGTTATASLSGFQTIVPGTTYYWKVTYTGDILNNGFTTSCGSETAIVTFVFVE
jgi:hypothetical protein